MPNWCRNILEITGQAEILNEFRRIAASAQNKQVVERKCELLNFGNLVPVSCGKTALGNTTLSSNLEDELWGCKGGAFRPSIEEEGQGFLCYRLDPIRKGVDHAWSDTIVFG